MVIGWLPLSQGWAHTLLSPSIETSFSLLTTQPYLRAPDTGRGLPEPPLSLHMASNVPG